MTDVLAAVDATTAGPVLITAALISQSLGSPLRAVHAEPWSSATQAQAAELGIDLELLEGPAEDAVVAAAATPDHDLVVIGLHSVRGRHAPGHLVHVLAGVVQAPLVIVPPSAPLRRIPIRILFPLDGSLRVSTAARPVIATYVAAGFEVLALHVFDPATVPLFHDGPEDEEVWRDEFLTQHFAELDVRLTTRPAPLVPALLEAALTLDADIIALPSRPDASASDRSVLRRVLQSADRPVALVPMTGIRPIDDQHELRDGRGVGRAR